MNRFDTTKKWLNLWEIEMIEQIRANLEVKHIFIDVHKMFITLSFVQNLFQFRAMKNHRWNRSCNFYYKRNVMHLCFQNIMTTRTPELCHAVFMLNFKHIQKINLIFSLLTLNMYLSIGGKIKPTKQIRGSLMEIWNSDYIF